MGTANVEALAKDAEDVEDAGGSAADAEEFGGSDEALMPSAVVRNGAEDGADSGPAAPPDDPVELAVAIEKPGVNVVGGGAPSGLGELDGSEGGTTFGAALLVLLDDELDVGTFDGV